MIRNKLLPQQKGYVKAGMGINSIEAHHL